MSASVRDSQGPNTSDLWLNGLTLLILIVAFLLIITGANMVSKNDWIVPQEASLGFDPADWQGIPLIRDQQAHIALGVIIWALATVVAVWSFKSGRHPVFRWLAVLMWLTVGVQAVLGWAHVSQISWRFSVFHASLSHVFLCLSVTAAAVTSPGWSNAPLIERSDQSGLLRLSTILLLLSLFAQVIIGVVLRHTGSGLILHIAASGIVAICLVFLAQQALGRQQGEPLFQRSVTALFAIFGAEIMLGFTSMLAIRAVETPVPQTRTQAYLPTVHVALGAAMVALSCYVMLRAHAVTRARSPMGEEISEGAVPAA